MRKRLPDDLVEYSYDVRGRLTGAKDSDSSVTFNVDSPGRVRSVAVQGLGALAGFGPVTLDYGYDSDGNRLSMSDSYGGVVYYGHYQDGKVSSVTNAKAEVYQIFYDGLNRLTELRAANLQTVYAYGNSAYVESVNHSSGGRSIASVSYTRNSLGHVVAKQGTSGAASYSYDANGFLTGASNTFTFGQPTALASQFGGETFTYDSIGNRTSDQAGASTYDLANQRLLEDGSYTYEYDAVGNMTRKFSKRTGDWVQFNYGSQNQLKSVRLYPERLSTATSKEVHFWYDALGRRIQKQVIDSSAPTDGKKNYLRRYVSDNHEVALELDHQNTLLARYTHSGIKTDDVLAVDVTAAGVTTGLASRAGTFLYLKDALGTVNEIADSAGNVVQRYNYSAFGALIGIVDPQGQDITESPVLGTSYAFTGREHEKELGLYYYRARFYDPAIGRFLQVDIHPGSIDSPVASNRYIYGGNNPQFFVDPNGEWFWVAVIVAAVVGAVIAEMQGNEWWQGALIGAGAFIVGAYAGGAAVAYFGVSGVGAIFVGAAAGAAAGGIVGAIGYQAFGMGSAADGFWFGLSFGAVGGGLAGAGQLDFGNTLRPINSLNNYAPKSPAWLKGLLKPRAIAFVAGVEPYVVGVGVSAAVGYYSYNCFNGNCNVPVVPVF